MAEGKRSIALWPDDFWYDVEDIEAAMMAGKSDDYRIYHLPDTWGDEEIENWIAGGCNEQGFEN